MRRHPFAPALLSAAVIAVALGGCSKSGEPGLTGPVAVNVNNQPIALQHVDSALAQAGGLPPEHAKGARKEVLDQLVEQELLAQQALVKKLDREPRVAQVLDASRRDILARAYLEQLVGTAAKPTDQEVNAYYEQHPELFKDRRVFNLRQLAIQAGADFQPKLQAQMAKGATVDGLLEWLKAEKIQFATDAGTKSAEQLPPQVLAQFQRLKDGEMTVIPSGENTLVVQVVSSQTQPVDLKQATAGIQQFLTNEARAKLVDGEIKKLRAAGKIEYLGEFAAASEPAKAAPQGAGAAPAATGTPAAAPAEKEKAAPAAPPAGK